MLTFCPPMPAAAASDLLSLSDGHLGFLRGSGSSVKPNSGLLTLTNLSHCAGQLTLNSGNQQQQFLLGPVPQFHLAGNHLAGSLIDSNGLSSNGLDMR